MSKRNPTTSDEIRDCIDAQTGDFTSHKISKMTGHDNSRVTEVIYQDRKNGHIVKINNEDNLNVYKIKNKKEIDFFKMSLI